ncbi:MAG: coenzyme F420-0:L-glutamate ligase [Candidatus Hodarchaeota archaeon]
MINIIGLQGIPFIKPGDNIPKIILEVLDKNNLSLENGDVIVIAQTIISKSKGLIRNLKDIKTSVKAIEIYEKLTPKAKKAGIPIKSPELIQSILDEAKEIIKVEHVLITETKHGFICANAGIDKSNVKAENSITLLPRNPDLEAKKIRKMLKVVTGKDVAVIISDSFGRAFRVGATGVALGVSGIDPILDKRGAKDLFGKKLESTIIGQVDNLASAAQLVMGEADEGLPVIIIRGYEFDKTEKASIKAILREKKFDLFREENFTNQFFEVLKRRRSYKLEFDIKEIDKKIIEECIDLARWAPSAHNRQFWRYIFLEKGTIRKTLIYNMNAKLRKDLSKDGRSKSFIENKIKKSRKTFLNAPYLILLCLDTRDLEKYPDAERAENEFILGVQSISASATYLLLAFQIKGLAACWYCAPLFSKDIIKNNLKLPKTYVPMAFIAVGYPLRELKAPTRKNLNDIIYDVKK